MKTIKFCVICLLCLMSFRSEAQYSFEWTGISTLLPNGVSNQVMYLDFGNIVLWGGLEVTLSSSFNHQNSTGLYRRAYNIGRNADAIYSNTSEVTSALGPVAEQWKLGDFEVNGSSHLVIPIYHLVSTGNPIVVHVKGISVTSPVNTSLIAITTPAVVANTKTRDYNYITDKLSIGTSKIDGNALLTVAGNIASREVKVKVDAGADFVFEDDYQVPDLASVERFVKSNRHLPGIAPANEMKASGLNVGDFQIKLLQKIEELTLHLIEMKKEIEVLKVSGAPGNKKSKNSDEN